jgi:hypothetical protein
MKYLHVVDILLAFWLMFPTCGADGGAASTSTVHVSEIPDSIETADVRRAFSGYGRVYQVVLTGRSAFVEFYDKESAAAAVRSLAGREVFGRRNISVRLDTDKAADTTAPTPSVRRRRVSSSFTFRVANAERGHLFRARAEDSTA